MSRELRSIEQLGEAIDWEGGIGTYLCSYAGRDSLEEYEVTLDTLEKWYTAWDAVEALQEALRADGVEFD